MSSQPLPIPRCWLMTDARLGDNVLAIARHLPTRSAIVIRPFALPLAGRAALIRQWRRQAAARRHWLIWAGPRLPAGFAGRLGKARRPDDHILVMPVHNHREAAAARHARATVALVSPVHPTRTHPGAPVLRRAGFTRLANAAGRPAIALGGMNARRYQELRSSLAAGWAAIDAWQVAG